MFLIAVIFVLFLALTFGIVALLIRPSALEKKIDGRIAKLRDDRLQRLKTPDEPAKIVKVTRLSQLDWVDGFLQRLGIAHRIQLLIVQAESSWSVSGVLASTAGLAAAGYLLALYELPNGYVDAMLALVFAALPYGILRFQRARRLKDFNRHLPEAIDLMSRALRAGHSLPAAIEIVGDECPEPVRSEFREVYRQQNFGLPAREALLQLAQRIPLAELNFVVTAMLLQKETGGNLVEILDRTTAVIRERLRIQGEIRIYTAQGRLTGWILSLLPIAMFFLLSLANRGYTRVLLDEPMGRKLVYTGVGLMVLGGLIIRKIVDVKV
jgi:tight adherence protein B